MREEASKDFWKRYVRGPLLGKGSFGEVYHVTDVLTGMPYACKLVSGVDPGAAAALAEETLLPKELCHTGAVACVRKEYHLPEEKQYAIIMDLANGDLMDWILGEYGKPGYGEQAVRYMHQLVLGLREIHRQDVVHSDIKPQNILLMADGRVAFSDFGLTCRMREMQTCDEGLGGTPCFMEPQMLLRETKRRTAGTDVFALGITFQSMLTKHILFGDLVTSILSNNYVPLAEFDRKHGEVFRWMEAMNVPEWLIWVLQAMCSPYRELRPSIDDITRVFANNAEAVVVIPKELFLRSKDGDVIMQTASGFARRKQRRHS